MQPCRFKPPLLACLLLVLGTTCNSALGQTPSPTWTILTTKDIQLHVSDNAVCGAPLFNADGMPSATRPSSGVDYCRELIIVDPIILNRLQKVSFKEVLQTVSGKTGNELASYFHNWAGSWNQDIQLVGKSAPARAPQVAEDLSAAWEANSLKLIAVVNRVDLAVPEGRLVYQLVRPMATAGGNMTIIVEFTLPHLDPSTPLRNWWANRWHGLGEPLLMSNGYMNELQLVVDDFMKSGESRIRTNEQIGSPSWELRQFTVGATAIQIEALPKTPSEAVRSTTQNGMGREFLNVFLSRVDVQTQLEDGTHGFMEEHKWKTALGVTANFPIDDRPAWNMRRVAPPISGTTPFLFAMNTCNGCHHDLLKGGAMHLSLADASKPAVLSGFLSGEIPVLAYLPPCRRQPEEPGCATPGKWNEVLYRTSLLATWAAPLKSLVETTALPPAITPLAYRYH